MWFPAPINVPYWPPVATLDMAYYRLNREQRRRRMFGKGNVRRFM